MQKKIYSNFNLKTQLKNFQMTSELRDANYRLFRFRSSAMVREFFDTYTILFSPNYGGVNMFFLDDVEGEEVQLYIDKLLKFGFLWAVDEDHAIESISKNVEGCMGFAEQSC